MSFEPTAEQRKAYRVVRGGYPDLFPLADLAQHAMAAAMEAEFMSEHYRCDGVNPSQCAHPLHKADWLKLADEKLRK